MSVLILEGVDGTGKTTLARALCDVTGFVYEAVGPPDDKDKALVEYLQRIQYHGEVDVVFDRFHWGSQAYGLMFRGRRDLSGREMNYLDSVLLELGCAVVYCQPDWDEVVANINARKKAGELDPRGYEDSLEKLDRVRQEFVYCKQMSPHPVLDYDFRRTPLDDVLAFVKESLGVSAW